jgi:uncharacterized protein
MVSSLTANFATRLRQHPKGVLLLMLVLALIGGYGASMSRVDNSLKVWQSEDDPNWLAYQQFQQRTQLADPLIILIPQEGDNLLSKISASLEGLPLVQSCQAVEVETLQGSKNGLLSLTPIAGASPHQLDEILQSIPSIFQEHHIDTYLLGGVWYLTNQLDTLSAKATSVFFPVVLSIVGLAVLFLCRSQALLILSCGLLPALLLVGILGLCKVKLNMVLLALPPLTLILGLAHAIHFSIKRWQPDDTVITIFCRVAKPCTLSGLTTALGFGSLLFSSYQPVRQLGLWGALGALLSLGLTFLLVPTFLSEKAHPLRLSLPQKTNIALAKNRYRIMILMAVILVFAGIGISRLQKGSLILDFFTDDSTIRQNYEAIEHAGIGLTPMEIDLFDKPVTRAELKDLLPQLAGLHPEISHYLFTMTDGSEQVESLGAKLLVPNFSYPGQKVERITILLETFASEKTLAMADQVEDFFQIHLGKKPTPYVTGSVPLYTRGQKNLYSSMLQSFAAAFLSISLLIGIMLRSVKMAFIAMVPNLLPVILVIAIMGWVSIPLSVATMTVASIIFGIVVDDTIHFLHSWQSQNKQTSALDRLDKVFSQVSSPIISTTLVTGTGFLAFLASPFIPLCHFGLLISLALMMALLCDLFILPILLIGGSRV